MDKIETKHLESQESKKKIKENKFSFTKVPQSDIEKDIKNISIKKAATYNNIPPKVCGYCSLI